MLPHFGEQLLMSVGKFGRALNDSVFEGFVEMAKLRLQLFLCTKMQAQRRLVRSRYEKQSLGFGWEVGRQRAGNDHSNTFKTDRRDRQTERAAKQRIGDRHRLPAARIFHFELPYRRDPSEEGRTTWRRDFY